MSPLQPLGGERFISLTTLRRSGEAVATPVWVGRDGEALVVLTPADSGKVKRLRHNPRVEMRPCGRFGKVREGATAVTGRAVVREDVTEIDRARAIIQRTYPVESRVILGVERLVKLLRGRPRSRGLALHITYDPRDIG